MRRAGLDPDPWQVDVLRHQGDVLGLTSRQVGKTECSISKAISTAIVEAPCNVLYTARTLRQAAEFMRRVRIMYGTLLKPARVSWEIKPFDADEKLEDAAWDSLPRSASESVLSFQLTNGSRIIGIPPKEETVRGYTNVKLLIIDEASRVPDDFYLQAGAFLVVSKGVLVAFTTPFGKRGWFYEAYEGSQSDSKGWKRVKVSATECPRLPAEWLRRERERIGERWFNQEYLVSFNEATDAVFSHKEVMGALSSQVEPLFGDGEDPFAEPVAASHDPILDLL